MGWATARGLRRDRSMLADAQRRYGAAADEDEALKQAAAATPDPPARSALQRTSPPHDAALTPLTRQARALYEGGVVPVRELARLCGVSVRTGSTIICTSSAGGGGAPHVPRDLAKSERQKQRYRALKALRPGRAARLEGARSGRAGAGARARPSALRRCRARRCRGPWRGRRRRRRRASSRS